MVHMELSRIIISETNDEQVIVLKEVGGERAFPIVIGIWEAVAIDRNIKGKKTPRPMTHDLLRNIINDLRASVERIVVCDLKENTFYATIELRAPGGPLAIDARPSDAIALALRTSSPIFVEEVVIQDAKSLEASKDSQDVGRLRRWLEGLSEEELGKYKM